MFKSLYTDIFKFLLKNIKYANFCFNIMLISVFFLSVVNLKRTNPLKDKSPQIVLL